MHLRALLFALLLPAAGCLTGTQHCKDAPPPDTTACFEFSNLASDLQGLGLSASLATLCTVIDAQTQAGSCPAEGRVGGCAPLRPRAILNVRAALLLRLLSARP